MDLEAEANQAFFSFSLSPFKFFRGFAVRRIVPRYLTCTAILFNTQAWFALSPLDSTKIPARLVAGPFKWPGVALQLPVARV